MYGEAYTKEQDAWIKENADLGIFRSQKHFTDVFNALFNTKHSKQGMNTHLYRMGITVKTDHHKRGCTQEQETWLIDNFSKYDFDFVAMANDFNKEFGTNRSNCSIAKYCERRLKLYTPRPKKGKFNKGAFDKGSKAASTDRQLPIGTIRTYSSSTSKILMIKVKLAEGDSGLLRNTGHNYKRPWWIPLKEKVWVDAHGEIPDGYRVIQLDQDYTNCNLDNLALADKRGLAIMASHKWWSDNSKFNATGIQWCNLYMAAKDNGVLA